MIRIIAGKYRSRKIHRVNHQNTRETSDFVRENVFNLIGTFHYHDVLDLFAGSGAYGFEALSRGAKNVHLNDSFSKAYQTLLENTKLFAPENENIQITKLDYGRLLKKHPEGFDLIFVDPPYEINDFLVVLEKIATSLKHKGLIVVEQSSGRETLQLDNFEIIKERKYGIKKVILYVKLS